MQAEATKESAGAASSSISTRALSRKNRVFVFREFLLRTYGEYLAKGATVLDVAGGKGDLSWLLRNVDGVDSVVADPRITKQIHILRSVDFLGRHPEEALQRSIPGLPTYQPLASLMPRLESLETFAKPRHLRLLIDQNLVDAIASYLETKSMENWKRYWLEASEKAMQARTLGYDEGTVSSVNQITDATHSLETILDVRLVIAFHPDQATDASVDLALVLGVPFCVVPCCVFPAEFPSRRNPDGTRLRTYPQLIDYLMRKSDNIRKADLDFPFTETAKNRVLYTLPSYNNELRE